MQQPRFRRQSVRRALSFLKERLWSNALVLSTQLVPALGWHQLPGAPEDEDPTSLVPVMSEGRLEEPSGRPVYSSSHSGARVRRRPSRPGNHCAPDVRTEFVMTLVGSLVNVLCASGLKVMRVGNTEQLPEDLTAATRFATASAIFGEFGMSGESSDVSAEGAAWA